MKEQVLKYIEFLRTNIEDEPQCFLFALMLKNKFDESVLYYDNNHIITKIGEYYYDLDGLVEKSYKHLLFSDYGDRWTVIHYNAIKSKFNYEK